MTRAVVLHQAVPGDAGPDEQDVLAAAASVSAVLAALGWTVEQMAMTLDLSELVACLAQDPPGLVFNLVESLPGLPSGGGLAVTAPALLQGLGLRFTGSDLAAIALSNDKPATKRVLRAAGIAVAPGPEDGWTGRWIVKHAAEHASFGLGPHSVVDKLPPAMPPGWFAEAFLDGREFNVSVLDGKVLPVAELVYAPGWPAEIPRILDYAGKWDPAAPSFTGTERRFGTADPALGARLHEAALACWRVLGLEGYARVDLRLDGALVPRVLDVNANPCLSEDSGFAAAAEAGGIGYRDLVGAIAQAALALPAPPPAQGARTPSARTFGEELAPGDFAAIGALCRATRYFSAGEIAVAEELASDRLTHGAASDYRFLLARDEKHGLAGYACFGPTPCTLGAWDLYWIVVHPAAQGSGLGRALLRAVAERVTEAGGTRLYAETSGRTLYAPTRAFYRTAGFVLQASVPGFYAPGDDKQIWALLLNR